MIENNDNKDDDDDYDYYDEYDNHHNILESGCNEVAMVDFSKSGGKASRDLDGALYRWAIIFIIMLRLVRMMRMRVSLMRMRAVMMMISK